MLNTYAEGITKMPENPGIPTLFADIFKNAYLPYRAPETLKSFLKIIDEFSYDHSERLGDAFEYIDLCAAYNISSHVAHENFADIDALHQSLQQQYVSA